MTESNTDWLDQLSISEGVFNLNQRDIVGEAGTVVLLVVDDALASVMHSAGREQMSSNDDCDSIIGKVLSAMSSGQDPSGADDGAAAEVVSVGTTQGGQVWDLTRERILSTNNSCVDVEVVARDG